MMKHTPQARWTLRLALLMLCALLALPAAAQPADAPATAAPAPAISATPAPTPSPAGSATPKRPPTNRPTASPAPEAAGEAVQPAAAQPTPEPTPQPTLKPGLVRVLLSQLEKPQALGITLDGSYSVEGNTGFRFDRGASISVAADGDTLLMHCGGLTINMGASLTLTRHETEGVNGLRIHETGSDNLFEGDLQLTAQEGRIQPILHIGVEQYLTGVVPYEMSDSFPLEALKAQAVAARTYVMRKRDATKTYDVVDSPKDQVYRGYNAKYTRAVQAVQETQGLCGTYMGGYATCYYTASNGGQTELPVNIWGGGGDMGYYVHRDDPYDLENPKSIVKSVTIPAYPTEDDPLPGKLDRLLKSALSEQMASLGYSDEQEDIEIVAIEALTPHSPRFDAPSRMYTQLRAKVKVMGRPLATPTPEPTQGEAGPDAAEDLELSGWLGEGGSGLAGMVELPEPLEVDLPLYDQLKEALELKINASAYELFTVDTLTTTEAVDLSALPEEVQAAGGVAEGAPTPEPTPRVTGFVLSARRFGHGVGMSQRGAEWMAGEYQWSYSQILNFYYPGMGITQEDTLVSAQPSLDSLPASVGLARPRPTPKPTPAPLRALGEGEYYAKVKLETRSSTLNVRETPSTSARILGALDSGARVIVKSAADGWALIETSELSGYVSTDYLARE